MPQMSHEEIASTIGLNFAHGEFLYHPTNNDAPKQYFSATAAHLLLLGLTEDHITDDGSSSERLKKVDALKALIPILEAKELRTPPQRPTQHAPLPSPNQRKGQRFFKKAVYDDTLTENLGVTVRTYLWIVRLIVWAIFIGLFFLLETTLGPNPAIIVMTVLLSQIFVYWPRYTKRFRM